MRDVTRVIALFFSVFIFCNSAEAQKIGNWRPTKDHNTITTRSGIVSTVYDLVGKGWEYRLELTITCEDNSLELYVSHDKFLVKDIAGLSRFNRYFSHFDRIYRIPVIFDKKTTQIFKLYENVTRTGIGLWGHEQSIPLIRKLLNSKQVVFMSLIPRVRPAFVAFDLEGMSKAIAPILKECNVKL